MKTESRRYRRSLWPRALLLLVFTAVVLVRWRQHATRPAPPELLEPGVPYEVTRVIDGDTLLLANNARVRLIGVDTPEVKHADRSVEPWGREATAYTAQFVTNAEGRVRLEFDKERRDRYDRFLAYVYAGDQSLGEELVRKGLARVGDFRFSDAVRRRLQVAEDEARAAGRGIWSK